MVQNITLSLGQVFNYVSINQAGVIPYLWQTGSTYRVYDPMTGYLITEFANASSGRIFYDSQGDMLVYNLGSNYLQMWNSTLCFINNGMAPQSSAGAGTGQWRPRAGTYDWTKGIQWRTTVPTVTGSNSYSCQQKRYTRRSRQHNGRLLHCDGLQRNEWTTIMELYSKYIQFKSSIQFQPHFE